MAEDCAVPDPGEPARRYEQALAADRSARRGAGAYYTPPHLVDFVLECTLGPIVAGRDARDLLRLRIVDPACGGGAFLLGALRFLERHLRPAGDDAGLRRAIAERCLVGVDLDPAALEACRESLAIAVGGPVRADLRHHDGLDPALSLGRVDAVVGNPPWGQKRIALDAATRRRYRRDYRCSRGPLDPFKLFVERSHRLLEPGGRWGLVLPDIVLLKQHEDVRDLILEESAIEWIAHAGRAFPDVNLDACVIAGRRVAMPAPETRTRIWHQVPAGWRAAPPPERIQRQGVFAELPGRRFNLHLAPGDLALMRRLGSLPRLGDLFEVHEGVHTGNARAKLFLSRRAHDACRPVVVGRGELSRYRLAWAGTWLDPRPEALDREGGDYANLGRAEWHRAKKIVVRRTGDRVVAAYDGRGTWVSNNLFVLVPRRRMAAAELRAFVAVLNSSLMTWAFRAAVPRVGRLFAELKITHMSDFPAPPPSRWNADRVAELAQLADRGRQRGAEAVAAEVDAVVESLYEVSPGERALITMRQ